MDTNTAADTDSDYDPDASRPSTPSDASAPPEWDQEDVPFGEHPLPGVRYGGCDLCGAALVRDDVYLGLVGNPSDDGDSTRFHSVAGPFQPGDHPTHTYNTRMEYNRTELGIICCNREPCKQCQEAPEAIYVHQHCLNLLIRECSIPKDAVPDSLYDFVWSTSAWRSPWRDTLYLCLDDNRTLPVLPPASYLSRLGLQGLAKLPSELVDLVRKESCRSLLWGYANVFDMARRYTEATSLPADELVTVPLSHVSSWQRDHGPVLADAPCDTGMIRLTIDSAGMQSIERLDADTLYGFHASSPRFDNLAFAVFDAATYPEAKVHFKYGLARLCFPRGTRHPDIWDTPLPPNLGPVKGRQFDHSPWRFRIFDHTPLRFRTVDLDKVTALSFLYYRGWPLAIHGHTSREPSAASTLERMAPWFRTPDMWQYMPISEVKLLISKLQNDRGENRWISLTRFQEIFDFPKDYAHHVPSRLVWGYHLPNQDRICVITSALRDPQGKEQDTVRHISRGMRKKSDFGPAPSPYENSAELACLKGIVRAQVFNDKDGYCQGIIFDYANGRTQALGSCPIGVVVPDVTLNPLKIHVRRHPDDDPGANRSSDKFRTAAVAFSGYNHPAPDWETTATPWGSRSMGGSIRIITGYMPSISEWPPRHEACSVAYISLFPPVDPPSFDSVSPFDPPSFDSVSPSDVD